MPFGRFYYPIVLSGYLLHFCPGERFCIVLNKARPLLSLETEFFQKARAGKGLISATPPSKPRLTFYSTRHRDLYQVRWSDYSDLWYQRRWRCQSPKCGGASRKQVQKPIVRVWISTMCRCLLWRQVLVNLLSKSSSTWPYPALHHDTTESESETGKNQDQVKDLIEKTASSLDDTSLKILFVSVQRNNIELCIQHAIN